jgi:hypothetical protein
MKHFLLKENFKFVIMEKKNNNKDSKPKVPKTRRDPGMYADDLVKRAKYRLERANEMLRKYPIPEWFKK